MGTSRNLGHVYSTRVVGTTCPLGRRVKNPCPCLQLILTCSRLNSHTPGLCYSSGAIATLDPAFTIIVVVVVQNTAHIVLILSGIAKAVVSCILETPFFDNVAYLSGGTLSLI